MRVPRSVSIIVGNVWHEWDIMGQTMAGLRDHEDCLRYP
jgi:hypothetical protein